MSEELCGRQYPYSDRAGSLCSRPKGHPGHHDYAERLGRPTGTLSERLRRIVAPRISDQKIIHEAADRLEILEENAEEMVT